MRERVRSIERWRQIGRLLPAAVRERVFEPAFEDLAAACLRGEARSGWPLGLRAVWTLIVSASITLPSLLERRRLMRLARLVAWWAFLGASILVIVFVALRPFLSYEG